MGLALLLVLSLAAPSAGAEPVGEGSLLAGRTMEDQHGQTGDLPSEEARGTLLALKSLRIASVQSFASAGELRNALLGSRGRQSPDAAP